MFSWIEMNTLVLLNLTMLLLSKNREVQTGPLHPWTCLYCDPDLCFNEPKGCPCGLHWDDRNFCFKCKVCRDDLCNMIKNDICEDGYICKSEFKPSTVDWYNRAGRCVTIKEAFSYEESAILGSH